MSENLCKVVNLIDKSITVNGNNLKTNIEFDNIKDQYCDAENEGGQCFSYEVLVSSIFIKLLKNFMNLNGLENVKHTQYAILWFCHKLNKNPQNGITTLKEFYNKYIKAIEEYAKGLKDGETYNSCLDIINKKPYSMSIDIKEMARLYEALKTLCKLYTECDEKKEKYTSCSRDAQEFANEFNKLNGDNRITGNILYREILFSLFNDYNDFKNGCVKKCSGCNNIPTLSEIKTPPSSSIASKLIPVLLTCSIPFFLGIAYKYSLFGFDKRLQGKHLRAKLKTIKKKINNYI
ncbi:CIR protein [Plasmodium chabaudi adami]|uniref:CIR protein n=1 Tax=Plasmodium chabaudi adami TaxID=5826 RepID=A0A1D3LC31_PLACE|nr:CIR protein [Plasmodium chabaudi adami]